MQLKVSPQWRALLWGGVLAAAMLAAYGGYRHGAAQPRSLLTLTGPTMGTTYTVKVLAPADGIDAAALEQAIADALATVNRQMSTYDPQSELSRVNRAAAGRWVPVSADTARVIDEALRIGRLTGGAFDVTIGPLVNLWNFGPGRKATDAVPSDRQIETALRQTGADQFEVRREPPAVRKSQDDLRIDLSGIAKGFAVDRLATLIEDRGIEDYMVEVGGETRTSGTNQNGAPWQIAVESPTDGARSIQQIVRPGRLGMATSGDYRNWYEVDGVRYAHILDPRSGRPVTHGLASASVLHASCATADAVATALMVLGPEQGYELAVREKLPVLLIVNTEHGFQQRMTPQFQALLEP